MSDEYVLEGYYTQAIVFVYVLLLLLLLLCVLL